MKEALENDILLGRMIALLGGFSSKFSNMLYSFLRSMPKNSMYIDDAGSNCKNFNLCLFRMLH